MKNFIQLLVVFLYSPMKVLTIKTECIWKDEKGAFFDISKLQRSKNYRLGEEDRSNILLLYQNTKDLGMFNMIYEFNFCSSGIKCHDVDVPAIEILEVMGTVTENCDILGMRNSQLISYIDPIHPEIGIQIRYSQGDECFESKVHGDDGSADQDMEMVQRSITFDINCASYNSEEWKFVQIGSCHAHFSIEHTAGCSDPLQQSNYNQNIMLLGGSFYFFVFCFVALAYFGGGIFYNHHQHKTTLSESIPNKEFWINFLTYLKRGIRFLLFSIVNLGRKAVGKQIPNDYQTV